MVIPIDGIMEIRTLNIGGVPLKVELDFVAVPIHNDLLRKVVGVVKITQLRDIYMDVTVSYLC